MNLQLKTKTQLYIYQPMVYHNWANLTFYHSLEHYGNQFLEGIVIGMVLRNNFQMFKQFAHRGNG